MTTEITSFAQLAEVRKRLLSLPSVASTIATKGAAEFSRLAQADFAAHESPYGDPWGEGRDGKPLSLDKSGRLKANAIKYVATGTTIRVTLGAVPYAKYQIKHGILPKPGAIPDAWNQALVKIANDELSKHLEAS